MFHIIEALENKFKALEQKAKDGIQHTEAEVAALRAHLDDLWGFLKPAAAPAPAAVAPAAPTDPAPAAPQA